MVRFARRFAATLLASAFACGAMAQSLPLSTSISGDSVTVHIGSSSAPVADLQIDFDDASGLSTASLGVSAQTVNPANSALLARLPDLLSIDIPATLPLLVTVEPPLLGGLAFQRQAHIELHTHLLTYTAGSRYRLMKAPLSGNFRDITTEVAPGSVRTRGTTGGFSQFLVVLDLRPTDVVIDEKLAWLRSQSALLSSAERTPIDSGLDAIEAAIDEARYSDAITGIDSLRARVSNRSGSQIPAQWTASGSGSNHAGELMSGLDTLDFSVGFLRDHGL